MTPSHWPRQKEDEKQGDVRGTTVTAPFLGARAGPRPCAPRHAQEQRSKRRHLSDTAECQHGPGGRPGGAQSIGRRQELPGPTSSCAAAGSSWSRSLVPPSPATVNGTARAGAWQGREGCGHCVGPGGFAAGVGRRAGWKGRRENGAPLCASTALVTCSTLETPRKKKRGEVHGEQGVRARTGFLRPCRRAHPLHPTLSAALAAAAEFHFTVAPRWPSDVHGKKGEEGEQAHRAALVC